MNDDTQHLTVEQIRRWHGSELSAEEMLAVDDHLQECSACRKALGYSERAAAVDLAGRLDDAPHPQPQLLESFVDGALDATAAARVRLHLDACPSCRRTAADLERFAVELAADDLPRPRRWWLASAALFAVAVGGGVLMMGRSAEPPVRVGGPVAEPAPVPAATAPVAAPPRLVVHDGELTITLDASGRLSGVPAGWEERVGAGLTRRQLALPALALAVARPAERQRAERSADSSLLLAPLSRVVTERRPTFRWLAQPGAEHVVEVFDQAFRPVASSGPLAGGSWRPAADLPTGEPLTWKLTVRTAEGSVLHPRPPAPPAVFAVALPPALAEVGAARASGSRLLHGLALWEAGAIEEAAAELAAVQRANPASPELRALAAAAQRQSSRIAARPPD